MNTYNWDDPAVIDSYLRVVECPLFKDFAKDEFEWQKVRVATKQHLLQNKSSFSNHFEFVRSLHLEAYDFNLGGFKVRNEDILLPTTRMLVSANSAGSVSDCALDNLGVITLHFPLNMVLSFERPLELSFVPVSQEIAEKYLKMLQENKRSRQKERLAYLRLRFKAQQAQPILKDGSDSFAHVYGDLLAVDVFADKELTLPLYSKKF